MAEERKTETYWDPNSQKWQTRTTFGQGQAKEYKREAPKEEAERGVKALFKTGTAAPKPAASPAADPTAGMSLGELATYKRKQREAKAAEEAKGASGKPAASAKKASGK